MAYSRVILIAALFLSFFGGSRGVARAITEYCPARVSALHAIGVADAATASKLFSYRLEAEGPRQVSADVVVDTTRGWFTVKAPVTSLSVYEQRLRSPSVVFRHNAYLSPPLYIRFAQALTVVDAYVSDAVASDDPAFGWSAKGKVQCDPPAGFFVPVVPERLPTSPELLDAPDDSAVAVPSTVAAAQAVSISAPGSIDCASPFSAVKVTMPMQPEFPREMADDARAKSGTTIVRVAVDAQGHVDDAWTFAPSGFELYDDATVRAARQSKYKPGTAFCKSAPGFFFYRADFARGYP